MNSSAIPQLKPVASNALPVYMQVESSHDHNAPVQGVQEPLPKPKIRRFLFGAKRFKIALVIVGMFVVYFGISGIWLAHNVKRSLAQVRLLKDALATKDLNQISAELEKLQTTYRGLRRAYLPLSWLRIIPWLGGYASDGGHLLSAGEKGVLLAFKGLEVVKPYADLAGFRVGGVAKEETAEDRINFIITTLGGVAPKVGELSGISQEIAKELSFVKPTRYKFKYQGKLISEQLDQAIESYLVFDEVLGKAGPLLGDLNYLAGVGSPRKYLLIFQNDKELRPTGGFITAYSIMEVRDGKLSTVSSNDIYNLDAGYKASVPAPDAIVKYLKGPYLLSKYLRLRDMNWSPDFASSMELFLPEAHSAGMEEVDGVISVDTQVLVNLLEAIGEVQVPGFGAYSNKIVSECNCPQVIYELESFADVEGPVVWDPAGTGKIIYAPPNYENRKKIIGPLMNSVLANAMGQPKEKLFLLVEAVYQSIAGKHIMLYLKHEQIQKHVADFGLGGVVKATGGDYLQINDANLGGRKSNLYVTQEVNYSVFKKGDLWHKTLEITYKNPEKHDGWLNSVLPNYFRVLVPKGSQLILMEGAIDQYPVFEELGYSVLSGYFELRPQGVVKVIIQYTTPVTAAKNYQLTLQKQPGTNPVPYNITVGKKNTELLLDKDKSVILSL